MPQLKEFCRPESLEEALALLDRYGERARPLAGGSSLMFSRGLKLDALVDLSRCGIDGLEESDDGLAIGAMVRVASLREYLSEQGGGSALSDAADRLYSRVMQNHVTVGGNCVMVFGWSHLPVATWCQDARFVLRRGAERRVVAADEYFERHPTKLLGHDELLVQVQIPKAAPHEGSAYVKFGRDCTDEGIASVAARITVQDHMVRDAQLIVGRARPMPQRLVAAAKAIVGKAVGAETFSQAGELASGSVAVEDNYQGSRDYRRHIVGVLVADALASAAARATGEEARQ